MLRQTAMTGEVVIFLMLLGLYSIAHEEVAPVDRGQPTGDVIQG